MKNNKEREFNINIDYTECYTVKAKSKEEAIKKAISDYEKNETTVFLSDEAEFSTDDE